MIGTLAVHRRIERFIGAELAIVVTRTGNVYSATVTPPHGGGSFWSSPQPVPAAELIDSLRKLGCHTTDITDALYEADPFWLERLKTAD